MKNYTINWKFLFGILWPGICALVFVCLVIPISIPGLIEYLIRFTIFVYFMFLPLIIPEVIRKK